MIETGKKYRVKGKSRYFNRKYGTPNPEILIESSSDYHREFKPVSFLYIGRMLAEGLPTDGITYYGHINGLGEFVHETELKLV